MTHQEKTAALHKELTDIMDYIKDNSVLGVQSIDLLSDIMIKLTGYNARSGEIMSVVKEMLHRARKQAYINTFANLEANSTDKNGRKKKEPSPLLVKDYINDCCPVENALYELAERTNRATTHTMEMLRTVISALKEEMKLSSYPLPNMRAS
jgi:hypothetical protein